jgi:hypothetical protein
MPHMLPMSAPKLCNPVAMLILMKSDDSLGLRHC